MTAFTYYIIEVTTYVMEKCEVSQFQLNVELFFFFCSYYLLHSSSTVNDSLLHYCPFCENPGGFDYPYLIIKLLQTQETNTFPLRLKYLGMTRKVVIKVCCCCFVVFF